MTSAGLITELQAHEYDPVVNKSQTLVGLIVDGRSQCYFHYTQVAPKVLGEFGLALSIVFEFGLAPKVLVD
ncbi:hypothetical protein Tco_0339585 [Tanacetum coccineum]